jgi:hypothetical protein
MIDDVVVSVFASSVAVHQCHVKLTKRIDLHELPLLSLHLANDLILFILVDKLVRLVAGTVVRGVLRSFTTFEPTFHHIVVVWLLLINLINNLSQITIESLTRLLQITFDRCLSVLLFDLGFLFF